MKDGSIVQGGVLIIAALPEELEAAKVAGLRDGHDEPGVAGWKEQRAGPSMPYLWGDYRTSAGGSLPVALTRPPWMGGRATGTYVPGLVERLQPVCLAMCGVCAGNPGDMALGDVVIAEPVYEWDEGKQTRAGLAGDQRQFRLDPRWLRQAQDFDPAGLASYGAASEDEAMLWLLERLHRGHEPKTHPARNRYFPPRTWGPRLERWQAEGWIDRNAAGAPILSDKGSHLVLRRLYDDVDGPQQLPFAVQTAPMASGSAVVADDRIWDRLSSMGMRKIAAVEMEGATIATIAHDRQMRWLVVKGIMDHANADKDERYKRFAARASAEVLFALLDRFAADLSTSGPRLELRPAPQVRASQGKPLIGLTAMVDALLALPVMRDDYQRRAVLAALPDRIRVQISDNTVARLHVVTTLQTCQRFADGQQALLDALRLALGDDSDELRCVAAVFEAHWPRPHRDPVST